jgi:hypothetical protein
MEDSKEEPLGEDWYRKCIEQIYSTDVFIFIWKEIIDMKNIEKDSLYKEGFDAAMKKVLDFMKERKNGS